MPDRLAVLPDPLRRHDRVDREDGDIEEDDRAGHGGPRPAEDGRGVGERDKEGSLELDRCDQRFGVLGLADRKGDGPFCPVRGGEPDEREEELEGGIRRRSVDLKAPVGAPARPRRKQGDGGAEDRVGRKQGDAR